MPDLILPGDSSVDSCPSILGDNGYQVDAGGSAQLCLGDVAPGQDETWEARFASICNPTNAFSAAVEAGGECGMVVTVPDEVIDNPGIYTFQWGLMDNNRPTQIKHGLLSVEQSLWNIATQDALVTGPLTINMIRTQLRDRPGGTIVSGYEYTDYEIVQSILRPLQYWNEVPPPGYASFTLNDFPYRYHWLEGTVANLLRIRANHLVRQSRKMTTSGGLTTDDRDKAGQYLTLAQASWDAFAAFCSFQKTALIRNSGLQVFSSSYPPRGISNYGFNG